MLTAAWVGWKNKASLSTKTGLAPSPPSSKPRLGACVQNAVFSGDLSYSPWSPGPRARGQVLPAPGSPVGPLRGVASPRLQERRHIPSERSLHAPQEGERGRLGKGRPCFFTLSTAGNSGGREGRLRSQTLGKLLPWGFREDASREVRVQGAHDRQLLSHLLRKHQGKLKESGFVTSVFSKKIVLAGL